MTAAEARWRALHAENERLRTCNDNAQHEIAALQERVQQLGQLARDVNSRRVTELEAQLEAVGAGGVEPLRKRCLHQISEPASGEAERAAFVAYLTEKFPTVYSEGAAEHWWDKEHVSALAWQGRAALAAQAQPAAQALDAARYRWVKEQAEFFPLVMDGTGLLCANAEEAEAEIDAAIAAKQEGTNG